MVQWLRQILATYTAVAQAPLTTLHKYQQRTARLWRVSPGDAATRVISDSVKQATKVWCVLYMYRQFHNGDGYSKFEAKFEMYFQIGWNVHLSLVAL